MILVNAGHEAYECWDEGGMGLVTGFSLSEWGVFNVSYVNTGIVVDNDTDHYPHAMTNWPELLRARAIFCAVFGQLYELSSTTAVTLVHIRDTFIDNMRGVQHPGQVGLN